MERLNQRRVAQHQPPPCRALDRTRYREHGLAAAGLELGRIQPSGRFMDGAKSWLISTPVQLIQRDIRELQLAKGAIAAGVRMLKIAFANGCFELLHVGHIRYLAAARDLVEAINYEHWVRDQTDNPVLAERRMENVRELLAWLERLQHDNPGQGLTDLMGRLCLLTSLDQDQEPGQEVRLMTLHGC